MTAQILAPGTYPANEYHLGPAAVPVGISNLSFTFDKTNWTDPAITLDIIVDISFDGGVTWNPQPDSVPFPYGFTAEGGGTDKFGNPLTAVTGAPSFVPQPQNAQRRVRATVIVAGGAIQTSCSLTVS